MNDDEIFERLQLSSRWGANNQPSIYLVTAILAELPIVSLSVVSDRIQFLTTRSLTTAELFMIYLLNPDEFHRDGYDFDLWWD